MSKIKIISCLIGLVLVSCTNEQDTLETMDDRTIVFTLSLPTDDDETNTRASLREKDRLSYSVYWNTNDVITLFFDYNNQIYMSEGKIIANIYSNNTASFSAQLPKEINRYASYRVYGICGKGGWLNAKNVPFFYASMYRTTSREFKAPVWFKAEVIGQWPETIKCSHLGAYEILHFKNKTNNSVNVTFDGFTCDKPWYNEYAIYNPLSDKLLTGIESVPMSELDNNKTSTKVFSYNSNTDFFSWYIPTGTKMKDAVLEMTIDGKKVSSVNKKSSNIDIKSGCAYHLYATWDGEKLIQGLEAYTDPLRISVNKLTMSLDDDASVDILSGNGSYTIESSNRDVVEAYRKGEQIILHSFYEGTATITIKDTFSQAIQTIDITVVNKADNLYGRIMRDMIYVEPGSFIMGDPESQNEYSSPPHKVTITKPYYISKFLFTHKLYSDIYKESSEDDGEVVYPDCALHLGLSWERVQGILRELNKKTNKYFRLPSNAEWEFAARGGNYSKGYYYPGSNNYDEVAIHDYECERDNDGYLIVPVGTKRPNELGIYDMAGYVWEWIDDCPYEYTADPEVDPRHKDDSFYTHIIRMGRDKHSWYFYHSYNTNGFLGFRLVLSVEENW